jgi:hypothetical protein
VKALVWLKGLTAALIGGAVSSASQVAASGNLKPAQLKSAAIVGAALTLAGYLAKSPLLDKKQGS